MWSTALSLITSVIGTSWFKPLCIALGCVASAWLGYSYSAHSYEAQIASLRQEMASATAQMEKENAQRLSKAIEERDSANNRIDALTRSNSDLLNRVRKSASSRTPTTAGSANESDSKGIGECRRLLQESAELLDEGCRLYGRCAAGHDALVELVK